MRFPLFIGFRYLFSKKSHNAINIITAISMICVAGVSMALVIILSAMNGLSGLVQTLYNSFNPDIRISPATGKTMLVDSVQLAKLRGIPGITYCNEVVEENALLEYDGRQMVAYVRGVGKDFIPMSRFDTLVREGTCRIENDGSQTFVVVGRGIAGRLGIGIEEGFSLAPLNLLAPRRGADLRITPDNLDEDAFVKKTTYVAGAYGINDDFDFKYVIVPVAYARELYGYTGECSSLELALRPGTDVDELRTQITRVLGNNIVIKDRMQQDALLYKTLKSEKLWTFIILLFILLIAVFNITGSLTMLIIEKKKDIGILWSMGADRGLIRRIFFTEGVLVTLFGVVAGILVGLLICWLQIEFSFYRIGEGFVVDAYPIVINWSDILLILVSVMAIGIFAAWYPVGVFTRKYLSVKFSAH